MSGNGIRWVVSGCAILVSLAALRANEIYINDASTTNDRFCSAPGSDSEGDGTKEKPFASVFRAFSIAAEGDTLFLDAGIYELAEGGDAGSGNAKASLPDGKDLPPGIDLNRDRLKLQGAGGKHTILRQSPGVVAVAVSASEVEVRDLAISGGKVAVNVSASNAVLADLWISAPSNTGIAIENAWGADVRRCHISGSGFRGLQIDGGGGHTILQCSVVSSLNAGFCLNETTNNLLAANTASANGTSGYFILSHSSRNALCGNASYGSGMGGFYLFTESTGNLLSNNVAKGNQRGFAMKQTSGNHFVDNIAEANQTAQFQIRGTAKDNVMRGNIGAVEFDSPEPTPSGSR